MSIASLGHDNSDKQVFVVARTEVDESETRGSGQTVGNAEVICAPFSASRRATNRLEGDPSMCRIQHPQRSLQIWRHSEKFWPA